MRLKPGRPDISRYRDLFDVPLAGDSPSVTFLGVTTLLLDDGVSAIMTDGFFSRPSLLRVGLGRIGPDEGRIAAGLRIAGVDRLQAVVPVHSHFDHALDSARVAELTGAVVAGGRSTANIARGHGLSEDRVHLLATGEPAPFGSWTVTAYPGYHCPPDRYPGEITEPLVAPAKADRYRCGEAWSLHVAHDSGLSAIIIGSAGAVPGALDGVEADVAYLGVGQLGLHDEDYFTRYWDETVATVGARRVVLVHWDDFFSPLDRPLRALPYAGDDLDVSIERLRRLAERDGVSLHLPRLAVREDPWADLIPDGP